MSAPAEPTKHVYDPKLSAIYRELYSPHRCRNGSNFAILRTLLRDRSTYIAAETSLQTTEARPAPEKTSLQPSTSIKSHFSSRTKEH